ncbi:hypothetical protein [Saccharothrix sp.]|uniref:hypothetical protein n=1 Tax=Saccharothrix sp. TaxID=1873460 RepID=UPI002811729D|nr:hypothetical protein [Saccharothrix sp.]
MTRTKTRTPAIRQAEMFAVLALHLTRNPDLYPVHLGAGGHLQLEWVPGELDAVELLKWADSLSTPEFVYSVIRDEAFVYVTGVAGGRELTVWTVVRGLVTAAGLNPVAHNRPLPADVLREFADGLWS